VDESGEATEAMASSLSVEVEEKCVKKLELKMAQVPAILKI
jgi:hypothetical protein